MRMVLCCIRLIDSRCTSAIGLNCSAISSFACWLLSRSALVNRFCKVLTPLMSQGPFGTSGPWQISDVSTTQNLLAAGLAQAARCTSCQLFCPISPINHQCLCRQLKEHGPPSLRVESRFVGVSFRHDLQVLSLRPVEQQNFKSTQACVVRAGQDLTCRPPDYPPWQPPNRLHCLHRGGRWGHGAKRNPSATQPQAGRRCAGGVSKAASQNSHQVLS